jgi:hypothetical protein
VILEKLEHYNIFMGNRGPIIDELGHASIDHTCPGVLECHELLYFSELLEMNIEEWLQNRGSINNEDWVEISSDEALSGQEVPKAGTTGIQTGIIATVINETGKNSHQGANHG